MLKLRVISEWKKTDARGAVVSLSPRSRVSRALACMIAIVLGALDETAHLSVQHPCQATSPPPLNLNTAQSGRAPPKFHQSRQEKHLFLPCIILSPPSSHLQPLQTLTIPPHSSLLETPYTPQQCRTSSSHCESCKRKPPAPRSASTPANPRAGSSPSSSSASPPTAAT